MQSLLFFVLLTAVPALCQRPFYAGHRPIGYPELSSTEAPLVQGNLPPQLNGDKNYADRLDKLPVDQQPFWYLNQNQYKEIRDNPQTYYQRPSGYNEYFAPKPQN